MEEEARKKRKKKLSNPQYQSFSSVILKTADDEKEK